MKVCIESDIELGDLALQIYRQQNNEAIIEFVQELDMACQDWDVTTKLYEYFKKEVKKLEGKKKGKHIQENV